MHGFQNLKIANKLLIAFGSLLVVISLVFGCTLLGMRMVDNSRVRLEETHQISERLEAALTAVADQRNAILEFLVTADVRFVETYEEARTHFAETMQGLAGASIDGAMRNHLNTLEQNIQQWQRTVVDRQLRSMMRPETVNDARVLEATQAGAAMLDQAHESGHMLRSLILSELADAQAKLADASNITFLALTIGGVLALLVSIGFAVLMTRTVSRPLGTITAAMGRLAKGDTGAVFDAGDRHDEVGELSRMAGVFRESLLETQRLQEADRQEQERRRQRMAHLDGLTKRFNDAVGGMLRTVGTSTSEIVQSSQSLKQLSGETARQVAEAAEATREASVNVHAVASSAQELSASITEISRNVSVQSTKAQEARDASEQSKDRMEKLNQRVAQISEFVQLVNSIASQTNLLALNATIEAARAGVHGKGFAVVASEVKSLANQTAKATEEIASLVHAIEGDTTATSVAIDGVDERIGSISEIAVTLASAVEEQTLATAEISRSTDNAARGTEEVAQGIGAVAETAQETDHRSDLTLASAEKLSALSRELETLIQTFLHDVVAA